MYFHSGGKLRRIDPSGILTTPTITPWPGFVNGVSAVGDHVYAAFSGGKIVVFDGSGTAVETRSAPKNMGRIAVAADGDIYFTDYSGDWFVRWSMCRVSRLDPAGTVTTVAGGRCGYSGDGGPGSAALLKDPSSVAFGDNGNLYVADAGNDSIRMVETGA